MQNSDVSILYRRWLATLQQHRGATALTNTDGNVFRFEDLETALGDREKAESPVTADIEDGVEFILRTLTAWRDGQALVPVDSTAPDGELLKRLPESAAHVKMTSGSTGAPRLVLFTGEQMAADADNIVSTMGLRPDWANVGVISMAHSYGFSNLVLPLLLHGIPLVLAKDALPNSVVRALDAAPGEVTLPAVPAMWKSWHASGILDDSKIRLAISAGAPLTAELERTVYETAGIKIHNFLGSSECGGIAYDRSGMLRTSGRTAGTALDGVELSVASHGCLEVRGASVGLRYWPDDDGALGEGVFTTQDLARIDEDGQVCLEGRAGDMINVAGRKVAPTSIEAAIMACPDVELCVVFGIPSADAERVEEIIACVKGEDLNLASLKKDVGTRLASWQMPRQWLIEPDLKTGNRGKISRLQWRDRFLQQ